jgi:phosphatidylglycerophosphate synthase
MGEHFTGGQKHLDHFLRGYEKKLIAAFLPLVPSWMGTVTLTLLTFLWSALIVLSGYLSVKNINWLWGFSACIFVQHITDMLDGEIGRRRNTGLIKWGFYMDHFLDYVFTCAIIAGYSFLLPPAYFPLVLLCLGVCGGFMVHILMDFSITGDFKISFNRVGVAEARYFLIVLNTALIVFGTGLFVAFFPFIVLISCVALAVIVCKSQKTYALLDKNVLKQKSE